MNPFVFKPVAFALMVQLGLPVSSTLRAPTALEWTKGLPSAQSAPDGSIILPPALAVEVLAQLKYADEYPDLCQEVIDNQHALDQAEMDKKLKEEKAKRGVPGWLVPVGGVVGFALGIATSILIFQAVQP